MDTTRFQIKRCKIQTFEGNEFKMVSAILVDKQEHKSYQLSEWLRDKNHVDRRNSCIKENEQIDESLISCKELFDLLDSELKELQNKNHQDRVNLLIRLRNFIRG